MGKQIKYSEEFKQKTASEYLTGNLSASQLAKSLGVHPHTVCNWIRQYNNKFGTIEDRDVLFQSIKDSNNLIDTKQISIIISEIEKQLELLKHTVKKSSPNI